MKVNKKDFYKYTSSIRKARVKVGLLLNGAGCLLKGHRKSLSAFFTSVFMGKTCFPEPQAPKSSGKVQIQRDLPLVREDHVKKPLNKLDVHNFTGPDGMQLQVLREVAPCHCETMLNYL